MPVNTSDTDFFKDILDFDEQERKLKKKDLEENGENLYNFARSKDMRFPKI